VGNDAIINTDTVLVRVMVLGSDSSTDWHYHSRVGDFFVCLRGVIKIETKDPDEIITLLPGQRAEVKPQQVHRVTNVHDEQSEYLLVQGIGEYDFIKVSFPIE
jgi:quercetin dioxygenase-like cupin family protein